MRSVTFCFLIVVVEIALMIQTCGEKKQIEPVVESSRDMLCSMELLDSENRYFSPLDNRYLMPVGIHDNAKHEIEGTVTVPEFMMSYSGEKRDSADTQVYFPGFVMDFFTYENHLVPLARDIVLTCGDRSYWSILVSPGTVWSEPGDGDMSRASFPFALVSSIYNEVHNGLATFLYDETRVSSLYLQVVQETAPWDKTDFWGKTPVEYAPHPIESKNNRMTEFADEVEKQIPFQPISALSDIIDTTVLRTFNSGMETEEISATGLVWDDTVYIHPCHTRYGKYPYPRYMRHGAFSLTKAMGALVALLRLAEKYGDDVLELRIADYVPITTNHHGWDDVTFADALNMATGIGDNKPERAEPNVMQGDEVQPKFFRFMQAGSMREKMEIALSYANYPWGPGEIARYNSINTFLLSAAMDSLLKSKEGPEADIWEMVSKEVYGPIGICHAPIMRTIEPDGSTGLPIFGYGLYPSIEDLARLSILMQNGGRYRGQQLLNARILEEALFRTDAIGLPTGERDEYGDVTYHLSFNGIPYRSTEGKLCRIPVSTGYGGNHWVLIPNGITAFRFCDENRYGVGSMIEVAEAIMQLP